MYMRTAYLELLFLILIGSTIPQPFGIPPLVEDPTLLRVIPSDSIAFIEWFGSSTANPKSANLTERLAAEPEIRAFLQKLQSATNHAIETEVGNAGVSPKLMLQLGAALLQRPGCIFLTGAIDPQTGGFPPEGGLVVQLGDQAPAILKQAREIFRQVNKISEEVMSSLPDDPAPIGKAQFHIIPMAGPSARFQWAIIDGYLVLTVGERIPKLIVDGLNKGEGITTNPRFVHASGRVRVARPSFRSYIDINRCVKLATGLGALQATPMLELLGVTGLEALATENGLEGDGFASRSVLTTTGRKGIFSFIDDRGLTDSDLAIVPRDTAFATITRLSIPKLIEQSLRMFAKAQPREVAALEQHTLGPLRDLLGLDLRHDLIAHLGDTIALFDAQANKGSMLNGMTLTISLADKDAFQPSFAKLMKRLTELAPKKIPSQRGRLRRNIFLESLEYRGRQIHFLNAIGEMLPIAPAWAVTDTHLVIGLFPQNIKSVIDRDLSATPSIAPVLKDELGPQVISLSLTDLPQLLPVVYPWLQTGGQMLLTQAQRQGFDLNISALPRLAAIATHLEAERAQLSVDEADFLWERKGTFPTLDSMLAGFVFVAVGVGSF